jgi:Ca2+-binding EF-hand superfamily protein
LDLFRRLLRNKNHWKLPIINLNYKNKILINYLDHKQIEDLKQDFLNIYSDNSGFIELNELEQAITKKNFHAN